MLADAVPGEMYAACRNFALVDFGMTMVNDTGTTLADAGRVDGAVTGELALLPPPPQAVSATNASAAIDRICIVLVLASSEPTIVVVATLMVTLAVAPSVS